MSKFLSLFKSKPPMEVLDEKVQNLIKDGANPVLKEQYDIYKYYVKNINDTYNKIIGLTKQINVIQFKTVSEDDKTKLNDLLKSMGEDVSTVEKTGNEISRMIDRITGKSGVVSEIVMKLALEMRQFYKDVQSYTSKTRSAETIQSILRMKDLQERLAALKMGGARAKSQRVKRRKMKASTRKIRKVSKTRKGSKGSKGRKTCRH